MKCQFDVLCSCISDRKIRDCLDRVPAGLDETYIRILARLRTDHSDDIDMVKKMFFWLVHSLRPLSLLELAEAVTLDQAQDRMDFSTIATNPADLMRFSGGLVTHTGNRTIVGLAHFSIKEFLLSDRIQRSSVCEFYAGASEIQLELTRICLNYLMMDDFRDGQCYSTKQLVFRTRKYRFLSYAVHHWVEHYHSLPVLYSESLNQTLLRFFTAPNAQNILAWQQIEERNESFPSWMKSEWKSGYRTEFQTISAENPIFNAARYGLSALIEAMCQMGHDVNEPTRHRERYPILIATCHKKHGPSMVGTLVAAGADINVRNFSNEGVEKRLLSEPDNWGLLQDLIRQGLKVENPRDKRDPILSSIAGHPSDTTQMAEFLLDNGADIDNLNNFPNDLPGYSELCDGPPLQKACFKGNLRVTKLLLRRGARKNFGSCVLGTPLHAAILGNHEEIVNLLLDLDVDINIEGGILGSPLQAAAWSGNESLVRQLLLRGSDVNIGGGCFGSALAAGIAQRNHEMTRLLLEYDADPNPGHEPRDCDLSSLHDTAKHLINPIPHTYQPIIWAIEQDDIDLVRILVKRGAGFKSTQERCPASLGRDKQFHPLCRATELGFHNITEYLISQGANQDESGSCLAIGAAKRGNVQACRDLLYASAVGTKPMSIFIDALYVCDDKETIQSLTNMIIQNGISIHVDLVKPLMKGAISQNLRWKVSWLLKMGVSPNVVIDRVRTVYGYRPVYALPFAIQLGHCDIARDLVISSADLNLCNIDCGTPLLAAFKCGKIDLMRELLRRGAKIDVPSCYYNYTRKPGYENKCYNLVHCIAAAGDVSVMKVLLEHSPDLMSRCDICETALWRAVKNEDLEMIRLLVQNGAKIDQCNVYGKPILRWAEENHLVLACNELQLLGAVGHQHDLKETIEQSVRRLIQELSTNSWTNELQGEISSRRWIMLGRCLYLGGDEQNAIIALEQTMEVRERWYFEVRDGISDKISELEYSSKSGCEICSRRLSERFHLCKDRDIMGICEKTCLKAHERELQIAGKLETHEYLMYPRSWFFSSTIPGNHVALSEGNYMPRELWLDNVLENSVASLS